MYSLFPILRAKMAYVYQQKRWERLRNGGKHCKIILLCYLCNIKLQYKMLTTAISIRLDSDIKKQFDDLCKEFGISTNAAFNLFARAVVREQAIPFTISLSTSESDKRSIAAQNALSRVQALSAQEAHEWTDDEIDELIATYRRKKRNQ